jgi:hypothetical protein
MCWYRVRLLFALLIFFLEEEYLGMADVRVILLLYGLILVWPAAQDKKKREKATDGVADRSLTLGVLHCIPA